MESQCQMTCPIVNNLIKENQILLDMVKKYKYDKLTGLETRIDYEEDINRMYIDSKIHNIDLYFTLIDIVNLHNYNIIHGYDEGDKYILEIVYEIKNVLPNNCKCYRIGGDEFAILSFSDISDEIDKVKNIKYHTFKITNKTPINKLITKAHEEIKKDKIADRL